LSSFCFVFNVTPEISTLFNISLRIKSHQETNSPRTEKKRFLNSKKEIRMYWGAGNFFPLFFLLLHPKFEWVFFSKDPEEREWKIHRFFDATFVDVFVYAKYNQSPFFFAELMLYFEGLKKNSSLKVKPTSTFYEFAAWAAWRKDKRSLFTTHTQKKSQNCGEKNYTMLFLKTVIKNVGVWKLLTRITKNGAGSCPFVWFGDKY